MSDNNKDILRDITGLFPMCQIKTAVLGLTPTVVLALIPYCTITQLL